MRYRIHLWLAPLLLLLAAAADADTRPLHELFRTDIMRGGQTAQRVNVDIRGAGQLHLVVTDGGDDGSWDHADWADAKLLTGDGEIVYLETLEPLSATQGYGSLARGSNLLGNPLTIARRRFDHGLGTSHDSTIVYALEGKYARFQAWVGLDAVVKGYGTVSFKVLATEGASGEPKMTSTSSGSMDQAAAIEVSRFLPVRPMARAERPAAVAAQLKNLGDVPLEVRVSLALPDGMSAERTDTTQIVSVPARETRPVSWVVTSADEGEKELRLTAHAGDVILEATTLTMQFLPPLEARKLPYIPDPKPARGDYLVGAHHCPLWEDNAASFPRWEGVLRHPERTPALGFYDQANPEVADWETKWASEHGVDFFIYCWYRISQGGPVETMLSSAIHEALFKSRFVDQMKFTIMWENQRRGVSGVEDREDLENYLFPFWMENFFKHPSYLKVDNKPVLFIYRPEFLVDDLGGVENVVEAFDWMRQACRAEGFDGLTILGEYRGQDPKHLEHMKALGLDYTFAYCWHVNDNPTPQQAIDKQIGYIRGTQELNILPQVVTVSQAWSGWHDEGSIWKIPPDDFERLMRWAKEFTATLPAEQLGNKMVLLDNWNEWGEGHYIAPYREYGFGYVDAVRRVFTDAPEAHQDLFPEDIGMGPYDTAYTAYAEKEQELANLLPRKMQKSSLPEDGLVAWWAFDEEGPVAFDYSGNRIGGVLRGDAERAQGIDGQALVCDGNAVEIPGNAALSVRDALTLSCWVRTGKAGQHDKWIINRVLSGGVNTGYALGLYEGKPRFGIPVTDWSHYLSADTVLPLGRWVHLAGTYDGKMMRIYMDGKPCGTLERAGLINPSGLSLFLGSFAPSHAAHFEGLLDEVKLYARALTPREIAEQAAQYTP